MLSIAVVADEYMVTEAFRYVTESWLDLKHYEEVDDLLDTDLAAFLAASKLFDHPWAFNKICKYMVLWFKSYCEAQPILAIMPPE